MANDSMAISLPQNSNSTDSEFESSKEHHVSFSQLHCHHIQALPSSVNPTSFMTPPSKKPSGRPPGSKNKIKPSSVLVAQFDPTVKIVSVDVPSGSDIIEYIIDVARRSYISTSIMSATGSIASVTLCHAPTLTLHGPFTLLSLNGSYLYNNQYTLHPGATYPPFPLTFSINLSTTQGQVFGGAISGKVLAGKDVTIMLFTYKNHEIYKIVPRGEDDHNNNHYNNKT